ncbi:hypothetical protein [Wukongibacter sp. M2B1]|uniref:hypothetical protein n=1 Tax=Wukongibacter sp. M2B1 TaxID=3088895 RepID=UPI003D7A3EE8
MKRKIVSLFLTFALILAFTVSSYANHGEYAHFVLDVNDYVEKNIKSSELQQFDESFRISIISKSSDSEYVYALIDVTTGDVVIAEFFTGSFFKNYGHVLDHRHDYKLQLANIGNSYAKGDLLVVIDNSVIN